MLFIDNIHMSKCLETWTGKKYQLYRITSFSRKEGKKDQKEIER